jgi:hypothetical protein
MGDFRNPTRSLVPLSVRADEELVMTREWGDPVCDLRIHMPAPMTLAAQPRLHISA